MLPGAMGIAPDSSPVGLYARLPELGEGEVVATALPAAASVLELGCGTGRILRPLARERLLQPAVLIRLDWPDAQRRHQGAEAARRRFRFDLRLRE